LAFVLTSKVIILVRKLDHNFKTNLTMKIRSFKLFQFTFILSFSIILFASCNESTSSLPNANAELNNKIPLTIVIHGGAGEIKPGFLSTTQENEYRAKLEEALNAGYSILEEGGKPIDAVMASISILENSPLFNAGKGAVLNHEGNVSMDASIMQGSDLNAGAITGIMHIKNPIFLARLVMDSSKHVFLSGEGAEKFAANYNVETEKNDYFIIPKRYKQLKKRLGNDTLHLSYDHLALGDKYGTVGCVAIDASGNIAAGTSTGGMVNKQWGRIGDSPVIGAGTIADNESCGISATGHGEYFIRLSIARNIADLIKYKGLSIQEAAHEVIQKQLGKLGGTGGIIGIDNKGNYCFEFNTPGMYRGVKKEGESSLISFYAK
jgi:beta-aspartyl-peptidase (threonine type)